MVAIAFRYSIVLLLLADVPYIPFTVSQHTVRMASRDPTSFNAVSIFMDVAFYDAALVVIDWFVVSRQFKNLLPVLNQFLDISLRPFPWSCLVPVLVELAASLLFATSLFAPAGATWNWDSFVLISSTFKVP